jgi:uncharacterized protein (TIGR03437 family)
MQRIATFSVCLLLAAGCAHTQTSLSVSPPEVRFRSVAGGFVDFPQRISVTATGKWTAKVKGEVPWLTISPDKGQGSGTVTLSLVDWAVGMLAAGDQVAEVVVALGDAAAKIKVTASVVPHTPRPAFSYLSGPRQCEQPDGYDDAATCAVPGEKPPGDFAPPLARGTYVDPNFGATIRLLSNARYNHAYSTPSPMSATNKYVSLLGASGQDIFSVPTFSVAFRSVEGDVNAGQYWDSYNDDVYYWLEGATVKKRDLRSRKTTTLVDYSRAPFAFSSISAGGTGDTSKDNWLAFWVADQKQVCALDLSRVKTYCGSYASFGPVPFSFIDYTLVTKGVDSASGKRYVLLMANPSLAVFSVNLAAERLDQEFRGPELPEGKGNHNGVCEPGESCLGAPHADVFEDADGTQYMVAMWDTDAPCERSLVTLQINKRAAMLMPVELGGGRKKVMTLFRCGVPWSDSHIGCAKSAPYCVISTNHVGLRDPADQTPIERTPHISEILVMRGNGAEIRRLMQHRSVRFKNEEAEAYWTYARAAIANDGAYVIADSNFGVPNEHRVILVQTGFGKPRIISSGVVNGASFAETIAPGACASIFGSNLVSSGCTAIAGDFPLPETLCGTTVTLNGLRARLTYASFEQLNFVTPQSLVPGAAAEVLVSRAEDASEPVLLDASTVLEIAPAMFAYALDDLVLRAVIQNNDDHSLNGPLRSDIGSRPLRVGEFGTVYANALGAANPPVPDGAAAPADPLSRTLHEITVFINGVRQYVDFAGLAPGFSALYQVNFRLEAETPIKGDNQDLVWLSVSGIESPRLVISLSLPMS